MCTNDFRSTKAITLIALVVSIVVLLILAGVSIVTLTGDNGLINRTTSAKQKTELATFKEKLNLAYMSAYADNAKNGTYTVTMTDMLNQLVIDYPEYGQEGKIVDGTQGGIKAMWGTIEVNATNGVLVSTTEPEILNIVPTSPTGEEVTKFVVIDGKYYEIILNGNGATLGEAQDSIQTSTEKFNAQVLTGLSGVTVTPATSGNNKIVTISGGSATSGTIGVSYGEYDITVKVEVKNLYTVSFYKESGVSEVWITRKVEPGQTIGSTNMPPNPAKENYIFKGWKVGSTVFDGSTTINANTSVYAEWEVAGFEMTHPANEIYASYFGKIVTGYAPKTAGTWRLFYADSNEAYLIRNSIGSKALNDSVLFPNFATATISEIGKKLNPKFTSWGGKESNTAMRGISGLLDTTKWVDYATNNLDESIANWAIGAPTLEMFIASYNATHTDEMNALDNNIKSQELACTVENTLSNGYKVKKDKRIRKYIRFR